MPSRKISLHDPTPPASEAKPWFGIKRAAELVEIRLPRLRRMIAAGTFPKPFARGTKSYWSLQMLLDWVASEMDRKRIPRAPRKYVAA